MIDARYHLVSIAGVFLALAVGIVFGSTELQGPTYDVLNTTTGALQSDLGQATSLRDAAQSQLGFDESYAASVEPVVLRGLLTGQRLVIITEPGAQPLVVTAITNAATNDAGATVTGQIALQPKLFDAGAAPQGGLQQVNQEMARAFGITLGSGETCQQQAAQILAAEILAKSPQSPVSQQESVGDGATAQTMLGAYAQSGFLTTSGQPGTRATLAVVITPRTQPADGAVGPLGALLVPLAGDLAARGSATVVAGSSTGSGPGSPIAALRASTVTSQVSTVGNADFVSGQTMVIQALATQLNGGKPGSYGTGASGVVIVAPGAAATPTAANAERPSPDK
jgi:Copper transport outer membrane protein, MctB